ncbi:MAG TPA: fibronectin type III domain-containing protein [Solirubrobacteraceae bacterium]|nr:fibronectin type III domain-containing protein [Solirubrobacteraceae bacterium]
MVLGSVVAGALLLGAPLTSASATPGVHNGPGGETDVDACSAAVSVGYAHCLAHFRTDAWARSRRPVARGIRPPAATLGNSGAYDPAFLRSAYDTPSATGGVGQTVAIVDAYDDPNAYNDMAYYRSFFGLPACSSSSGCFQKVNESGGTSSYPSRSPSWGQEISLDLDMVSAICPNCHILLVEASTNSLADLGTAVNTAVKLGANVVTNSYGGSEYSAETSDATAYYAHAGVAITAASGDSGYGVEFPAASPTVTAVGGTTLYQATNTGARNATEEAWSGAGSGCSAYESQQKWQLALVQEYSLLGCNARIVADASAVANPSTGVWVYDTYSNPGFEIFGGTSVSAQIVGAVYALADNAAPAGEPSAYPYGDPAALNYIHAGSNSACGTYLCNAADSEHYNGPTGLGTPNGTAAFTGSSSPPSGPPSAPTGLTAKAGNAQVRLSWSAPGSTGGAAVSYQVFRGTSAGGEATTPIATGVTSTSFTDSGLTNGTAYYYTVKAVNSAGGSEASNEASATPAALPGAPRNLTAATSSTRGVALAWSAPASNGGAAVAGYVLYRGTRSGRETVYGSVSCSAASCTYNDSATRSGTTYYYTVAAVNTVGTGPQSNQASARAR